MDGAGQDAPIDLIVPAHRYFSRHDGDAFPCPAMDIRRCRPAGTAQSAPQLPWFGDTERAADRLPRVSNPDGPASDPAEVTTDGDHVAWATSGRFVHRHRRAGAGRPMAAGRFGLPGRSSATSMMPGYPFMRGKREAPAEMARRADGRNQRSNLNGEGGQWRPRDTVEDRCRLKKIIARAHRSP